MAYIGREPTNTGEFLLIDDISGDFNGSDVSFTLQVGLLDVTPAAANTVIVLDGVVQEPTTAYSISGSTITFTEAPDNGLSFYGLLAGQSQYIANSSVTNEHISAATSISGSKISTDFGAQNIQITHITASGNISASGIVIADTFQSTGGDIDGISFTDDLNITGNITASGNISASGIFTAEGLVVSDDANITDNLTVGGDLDISDTIYHTGDSNTKIRFPEVDTITFHTSGNERMRISAGGHITASGAVSASGTITANQYGGNISGSVTSTGSFGKIVVGNDIDLVEDQRIHFEADKTTYIESHASDTLRAVVNNRQMFLLDEDTGNRAVFGNGTKVFVGSNNNRIPTASLHIGGDIWASGSTGNVTASGNISSSANIIGNTFTGTFNGVLSSSAQEAASISGSFGNQRVGTTDDVKFANITGSNNISASGNLSITGNVDVDGTSNFSGNVTLQNDLTVTGRIDAEEIHTTFISSSIAQATGSNIFGDSVGDSHQFTGSIDVSGSGTVLKVSDGNVVVSDTLTATNIGAFTAAGAIDFDNQNMTNVDIDSGNIDAVTFGSTTKSMISGSRDAASISGSRDAASISGSFGNQRVGTTDDVKFANITGSGNISGSFTSTGSFGHITLSEGLEIGGVFKTSLSNNDLGSGNTIFGKNAGANLDAGSNNNVFIGENVADHALMDDCIENIAIGYGALSALVSGDKNITIGYSAGELISSGSDNILIGDRTGDQATDSEGMVVIGSGAATAALTNGSNGLVAIGYQAGAAVTSAAGTTLVGYAAGDSITTGNNNTAIGRHALGTEDTNIENTAVGFEALKTQNGADGNTAVGFRAGLDLTSGGANTFVGAETAANVTTGADNVMMGKAAGVNTQTTSGSVLLGRSAGRDISTGNENIAIGKEAMFDGTVTGDNNIAIGTNAGDALTSGFNNIAIGKQSFTRATTANENVAIGNNALGQNTYTSSGSVAIGYFALGDSENGATNVGIGYRAGKGVTTGWSNVIIGKDAARQITTARENVIIGAGAYESANSSENYAVVIGYNAGNKVDGIDNVHAIGYKALENLQAADGNTAVGFKAGIALTTGVRNTFIGHQAGTEEGATALTGEDNICIGYQAGLKMEQSANRNILIGSNTGDGQTVADDMVFIGHNVATAVATTDANGTVAVGSYAASSLTSGGGVFIGFEAGLQNTTAVRNVVIGYEALDRSGGNNSQDCIAIGHNAMHGDWAGQGLRNIAIGSYALEATINNANDNTVIGHNSGGNITSGDENTFLGGESGDGITTGGNNTMIGYGTDGSANNADGQIVLGHNCIGHGDNKFTFGDGSGNDRVHCTYTSGATFSHVSDERYKKDIKDTIDIGLDFINDLRTVTFKWKAKSEIDKDLPDYDETALEPKYDKKMYGLIAQEVKETLDKHNITDSSVWDIEETTGIQSISNDAFVFPLIKAVQELSQKIEHIEKTCKCMKEN